MRLNINLATQPYEDARRFTTVWTGILGGLLVLAILLSYATYRKWTDYRTMTASINREKVVLADYENKQKEDIAILNRPQNREVRERSEYLNDLIRRKEVSWTKIFTDLEKMMPPHLRVLGVEPKLDENGLIIISMQLGGDSRERAAELVRRMEHSKTFHNAQVVQESNTPSGPGQADDLRFGVQAEYVPGMPAEAAPAATPASTGGGQ